MSKVPSILLSSGFKMPQLGYGTFLSKPGEIKEALKHALNAGYRHIDCAAVYGNEKEIGEVFNEVLSDPNSGIKREDLFVTSKIPCGVNDPSKVEERLRETLKDLQLEYLDLYLVHMPVKIKTVNEKPVYETKLGFGLQDLWRAMEATVGNNLTKSIGVSNYNTGLLYDCLNYAKIPPAVNQIEIHPYHPQYDHVQFCLENNVQVTAYAPIGAPGLMKNTNLLDDPVITGLATKHNKTPAQILIRWGLQRDYIVIPKSVKESRIQENFDVLGFELSGEEIEEIKKLDKSATGRTFGQTWMSNETTGTPYPMFS